MSRAVAAIFSLLAFGLGSGDAHAGREEQEVCVDTWSGARDCYIIVVYTESDDGSEPSPVRLDRPRESSWFDKNCRMVPTGRERTASDGTILREYYVGCNGFPDVAPVWVADTPGGGPPVPAPDPYDLALRLWASMRVEFPVPTARVAPSDENTEGFAFVQIPTFFWVDDFRPITRTLALGPAWVTLTATPARVEIDPGTGDHVTCVTAPPFPWGTDPDEFDGCAYTYVDSSAMAPDGATWPLTVTVVWTSSWTSSSGAGGTFGEVHMQSPTRDLPVAEIQAVVVQG